MSSVQIGKSYRDLKNANWLFRVDAKVSDAFYECEILSPLDLSGTKTDYHGSYITRDCEAAE